MRLRLIAVGRLKPGPHLDLQRHYAERIRWPLDIREVEERRKLPPAALKEREGALLLAELPADAVAVALDARGKPLASEAFAAQLATWRDAAADVAFLIGGAEGLADAARRRADRVLSLGPMVWPHFLVRGMLLEQIYRAQQILAGHPYHRAD